VCRAVAGLGGAGGGAGGGGLFLMGFVGGGVGGVGGVFLFGGGGGRFGSTLGTPFASSFLSWRGKTGGLMPHPNVPQDSSSSSLSWKVSFPTQTVIGPRSPRTFKELITICVTGSVDLQITGKRMPLKK